MADQKDYVGLGLTCANVCAALDQGLRGERVNELSHSVSEVINQLAM